MAGFGSSYYDSDTFCNFCVQNMPILHNFVKYFKIEAKALIEAAEKDPILIDSYSGLAQQSICKLDYVAYDGYDFKLKKQITLRLTKQEAACLEMLSTGKTFKEVARSLTISPRTVEGHIYNVKMKSKTDSTNHLIKMFSNLVKRID